MAQSGNLVGNFINWYIGNALLAKYAMAGDPERAAWLQFHTVAMFGLPKTASFERNQKPIREIRLVDLYIASHSRSIIHIAQNAISCWVPDKTDSVLKVQNPGVLNLGTRGSHVLPMNRKCY